MSNALPRNESVEGVGKEAELYTRRFSNSESKTRNTTWNILVPSFLQQFVPSDAVVVDVGAGMGEFILNIKARKKIAVDLSEHVRGLEGQGVEVLVLPATEFSGALREKADLVFMSNFLEHLPDKRTLLRVLEECGRALKSGGKIMILQPNIRYVGAAYWDYVDHHIALTEFSLVEALEVSGFKINRLIPRFLPYTAKSTIGGVASGPLGGFLVRTYLRLPFLWKIFGQQTFVVAEKI